jgi:erythronate-4-phosphate dehydrogenase
MKIIADENIPLVGEAFGPMGEVVAVPADAIRPLLVRDAQALLVRSVTPVGPALLDGSAVRFVATATIGVDHIDQEYLRRHGIGFSSAQGSNARSVAEYVFTSLAVLAERGGWRFRDKALGIVGVGNIGSRVARMAEGLGLAVLRNDPPLACETGDPKYVPIETLFDADIVTFHVPLTREGPDATHHMIGESLLSRLKRSVILLNTSRGSVADTAVLKAALGMKRLGAVVLDVWENEPNIDLELMNAVDIATPHIAGYSYDGKVNGTRMILHAFCRHFGLQRMWDPSPLMPPPARPRVVLPASLSVDEAVTTAIRAAYDIEADDQRMRGIMAQAPEHRADYFKSLRRHYPVRREFPETTVALDAADRAVVKALETLGFPTETRTKPK